MSDYAAFPARRRAFLLASVALAAALAGAQAQAQTPESATDQGTDAALESGVGLAEVVVTAAEA